MRPPSRRRRPIYLVLLLVLIILFFVFRRNSSSIRLSDFSLYDNPSLPRRDFGIILHPKDHITRLPTSLEHHWNITKGLRAPDGVNKTVYLINGETQQGNVTRDTADISIGKFPGPTIEARTGDQLVIVVSNQLEDDEGIAFHWHGLHMKGICLSIHDLHDMLLMSH